jgi:GT2 family glycosyltransferase
MYIDRVAVLTTAHSGRELTLASLESLFRQRRVEDLALRVFLVDYGRHGSADGTGDAARARFPMIYVLDGDGSLSRNGGLRLAFGAAMDAEFDAYIFFNDDTVLYKDALERAVSLARERMAAHAPAIIVGSTRSPLTGEQSHGGFLKQNSGAVCRLEMVGAHASRAMPCDTMNGAFALIPACIAAAVGNLDEHFDHRYGDLDYGLRAKRAGFDLLAMPGYAGDCFDHRAEGQRAAVIASAREWTLFVRRHFGWRWATSALWLDGKTLGSSMPASLAARSAKGILELDRRAV